MLSVLDECDRQRLVVDNDIDKVIAIHFRRKRIDRQIRMKNALIPSSKAHLLYGVTNDLRHMPCVDWGVTI